MSKDKDLKSDSSDNSSERYSEDKRRRTQALHRMIQSLRSLDDEDESHGESSTTVPATTTTDSSSAVIETNTQDSKIELSTSNNTDSNIKSDEPKNTSVSSELTSDANTEMPVVQDESAESDVASQNEALDTTADALATAWESSTSSSIADGVVPPQSESEAKGIQARDQAHDAKDHNPHAFDSLTSAAQVAAVTQDSQSMLPVDTQSRVIETQPSVRNDALASANVPAPWTLQQFFNGEIDLDVELTRRFPNMPMMSLIKFRTLGARHGRNVATLRSQDGSATVIIDADKKTKTVWLSFTIGSMLTLRFSLDELSDMDRTRWLDLMGREQGGLAFLWGAARWAKDYTICISRKYHTNLYAFSPNNFEAAVRLTPAVTHQLLEWLEDIWQEDTPDDEPPKMLTW